MEFRNKTLKTIVKTDDKFVIEQLKKSSSYEEIVKEVVKEQPKKEDKKSSK